MEKFELKTYIEQATDNPQALKQMLFALFDKIDSLEQKLANIQEKTTTENKTVILEEKRERLDRIRHSLTELTDRMQKPYVVSAELEAVKEVLNTLAETGECNSIILEGEPGTGKTQWAYSEVGQELQEGKDTSLIHIRVKDSMRAQDLLYSIDDVRRLSDAQAQAQIPQNIQQEASEWKEKILTGKVNPLENAQYQLFKAKMNAIVELGETAKDLNYLNYVDLGPLGEAIYQSGKGRKTYLVIDEIEKGREELMTGILDEIENLNFIIGETGTVIKGDKKNLRIIITTNTEDSDKIPPSFRRRSLYHFIDYPNRANMAQIIQLNFPDIQIELLNYAISVFYKYHENSEIEKPPSTPELLAWIKILMKNFNGSTPNNIPHKEILLKYQEDQKLDMGEINTQAYEMTEQTNNEFNYLHRAFQGDIVYHINEDINDYDEQSSYTALFAKLHNQGINFITPEFQQEEIRNEYGDWEDVQNNITPFRLIIPGVEHLGNGYYTIPQDKLPLLEEIIDTKTELLPAGQQFKSVYRKNKNITIGDVYIDGFSYTAYMNKDGQAIIHKSYHHT